MEVEVLPDRTFKLCLAMDDGTVQAWRINENNRLGEVFSVRIGDVVPCSLCFDGENVHVFSTYDGSK
jgi:hypothetical protein